MQRLAVLTVLLSALLFSGVAFGTAPSVRSAGPLSAAIALSVSFSFSPNPVSVNTQTQGQVSVSSGVAPFYLWMNGSIPGCSPPQQPIQQSQSTFSFQCTPTATGNFNVNLDVADSAGNHGSTATSLTVQSNGGSGTNGGNGSTGGSGFPDLSGLQNLIPVLMVVGFIWVASMVAIAASAVAFAILVPRQLKQIRKVIQGEPLKKVKKAKDPLDEEPPK